MITRTLAHTRPASLQSVQAVYSLTLDRCIEIAPDARPCGLRRASVRVAAFAVKGGAM